MMMVSYSSDYTKDTIDTLRATFIENPKLGIKEVARRSEEIVGQKIQYDNLRHIARNDEEGNWHVLKRAHQASGKDADINHEVDHIRRLMYRELALTGEEGLLIIGNYDQEEVRAALGGIAGIEIKEFGSRRIDHNLVNAYMNILSKSNMELNVQGTSAKTPREQVLDLIEESLQND